MSRYRRPTIGKRTQLKKQWVFDPSEILELFKTKTCDQIAAMKGCNPRTISRFLKKCLDTNADLRAIRFPHLSQKAREDLCRKE